MPSRGQALTITYVAWDTAANAPKTGDAANHTLRWVKDGVSAAPAAAPSEVDAVNARGVYAVALSAAECTANVGTLAGVSSTADVSIIPVTVTFEMLPLALAGTGGIYVKSQVYDVNTTPAVFIAQKVEEELQAILLAIQSRTNLIMGAPLVAEVPNGITMSIRRGDTAEKPVSELGSLVGATDIWFTVKRDPASEADTAAVLQVSLTAGLERLKGAAAGTPSDGSITIVDALAGEILITVKAAATAVLEPEGALYYDIQTYSASTGAVATVRSGYLQVLADVTRALS